MTVNAPTSPLLSITPSEVVAKESSNAMTASSDLACVVAPATTASSLGEGAPKSSAPCDSQYMHRLVTAVSSDDSVAEAIGSSPSDNPAVQDKSTTPPIVHHPSTATNTGGTVSDPLVTSNAASAKSGADVATTASTKNSTAETARAATEDCLRIEDVVPVVHSLSASNSCTSGNDKAPGTTNDTSDKVSGDISSDVKEAPNVSSVVQKECLLPVVYRPSAGTVSAPGTSHDMPVKGDMPVKSSSDGITTIKPSEEPSKIVENTVQPNAFDTVPVSAEEVARVAPNPASGSGEVNTTVNDTANPSRAMILKPSTIETDVLMGKHIQVASIAERVVAAEVEADEASLAKKRKIEVQPTKNDQQVTSSKKFKVPKDPNAPKKNMSAYMHYATYARAWFKTNHPQFQATDVTARVQSLWRGLPLVQKNHWEERAAADKVRYEKEFTVYQKSDLFKAWEARVEEEAKAWKAREEEKERRIRAQNIIIHGSTEEAEQSGVIPPKPNVSAFTHYDAYARDYIKKKHPNVTDAQYAEVVLRGWNAMNAMQRNHWLVVAYTDAERYHKELKVFNASKQAEEQREMDSLDGAMLSI